MRAGTPTLTGAAPWTLSLAHGGGDLVVTLAWTDLPAAIGAGGLVHDLDLRVLAPDLTTHFPYTPDPESPDQPATTGDNTRDPIEQIRIPDAEPGTYTISITAKSLTQPQRFAYVAGSGDPELRRFQAANAGWRLIGVPFAGIPFGALNAAFFTQGGPGSTWATHTGGSSNLLLHNDHTNQFEAPAADGGTFEPGRGYLFYQFEHQADWVLGGVPVTEADLDLPWRGVDTLSYALLANPYAEPLDFHALRSGSDGLGPRYAVWNPEGVSGGGSAGYAYYNATTGLGNAGRYIAPFAGFWAHAAVEHAEVRFRRNQTRRGVPTTYFGKERGAVEPIRVVARGADGTETERWVVRGDGFAAGFDAGDTPMLPDLMGREGFAILIDGSAYAHAAWPADWDAPIAYRVPPGLAEIRWEREGEVVDRLEAPAAGTVVRPWPSTEAGEVGGRIKDFRLGVYPNPFNPSTEIGFPLSVDSQVLLIVYDLLGREVARLVDGHLPAGSHRIRFDAAGLASGVYMARLTAEGGTAVRLMLLLK